MKILDISMTEANIDGYSHLPCFTLDKINCPNCRCKLYLIHAYSFNDNSNTAKVLCNSCKYWTQGWGRQEKYRSKIVASKAAIVDFFRNINGVDFDN